MKPIGPTSRHVRELLGVDAGQANQGIQALSLVPPYRDAGQGTGQIKAFGCWSAVPILGARDAGQRNQRHFGAGLLSQA
jgi:hypothetical protein